MLERLQWIGRTHAFSVVEVPMQIQAEEIVFAVVLVHRPKVITAAVYLALLDAFLLSQVPLPVALAQRVSSPVLLVQQCAVPVPQAVFPTQSKPHAQLVPLTKSPRLVSQVAKPVESELIQISTKTPAFSVVLDTTCKV